MMKNKILSINLNQLVATKTVDGGKNVKISTASKLDGDKWNLVKLLFLYILQGVPLGFADAFPIILKSKEFSYNDQAMFSVSLWPFTLKIVWAPLVDSMYCSAVGRRKMWLVPTYFLLGTSLLFCSKYNNDWLMNSDNSKVIILTVVWLIINCLAATQDIVVDGWGCSMLQKHNIHYASICNATGQSLGSFLGYVGPLLLGSEMFCNKWIRINPKPDGLVTLDGCLYFWGVMYIIAAFCVCTFKSEILQSNTRNGLGIWGTYKLLWSIMKLPNVKTLAAIFVAAKVGFATADTATNMEFIEAGVSENYIVIIGIILYLVKFIIPITLTSTNTSLALDTYMKYIPYRLLHGLAFSLLLYYSPLLLNNIRLVHTCFTYTLGVIYVSNQICTFIMYVSYLTFLSEVSDPNFGGTYMTLLGTFANIGIAITKTVSLWMIDILTYKQCSNDDQNYCTTSTLTQSCQSVDGVCVTVINGYYAEIAISLILGVLWFYIIKKPIQKLQMSDKKSWIINNEQNSIIHCI